MGWMLGYDENWKRDVGYDVPAYCDHPGCTKEIERGLSYVCGSQPYGGDTGCGLYFCNDHLFTKKLSREIFPYVGVCSCCCRGKPPFDAKPDHPTWLQHKLTDESWAKWREENPEWVKENTK